MEEWQHFASIEIRLISEDDCETSKVYDFVFSLYHRNLITIQMYINKVMEIENDQATISDHQSTNKVPRKMKF